MRGTSRFEAGSRFKYTPNSIEFSYNNLVKAIGDAIDQQEKEDGAQYFTDSTENVYTDTTSSLDFDELIKEFNTIIGDIPGIKDTAGKTEEGKKFAEYWQPRIAQCIEKYLGKGKKIKDATRDQVEAISLIVEELKEIVK